MFRSSQGQRSGGQIVGVFSTADLPVVQTQTTSYPYTGSNTTIVVPTWATVAEVKEWGAAGGGGFFSGAFSRGGAGAFVGFTIPVVGNESLIGMVGQGGYSGDNNLGARTYGGGGVLRGSSTVFCGAGGGFTALYRGATLLGIAGAGGGGDHQPANNGGAGGGAVGQNAIGVGGATGGSQSLGGNNGGASLLGGNGTLTFSGGGGSGFFGGGVAFTGDRGAGAGGSSWIIGTATSPVMTAGSGFTPGNNADPHYVEGVGVGGLGTSNGLGTAIGGNGLLVITFRSF